MHDLGLIIYYDSDEGLKDVVVLNPEWLTKAISYVLDPAITSDVGGVLAHTRLKAIWQERENGYPSQYHAYFLRLMEKFDISYRLDNDETHSLIPQLVPHAPQALPWSWQITLTAGFRSLSLTCSLSERHYRASPLAHRAPPPVIDEHALAAGSIPAPSDCRLTRRRCSSWSATTR